MRRSRRGMRGRRQRGRLLVHAGAPW
jgi:hypothetical protein